ncbi:MAG: hypothetical protein L6246_10340 [Thermodesulfovibrionales bacterium]|nr:hypothetical protein [Nitrospinota bacterium]MCG2710698.1 hypothetical protein [Thermodesulfovibrionales bacterium]
MLLLDADVIIDLHKFGLWNQIAKNHKVNIPSIILRREVYFFESTDGNRYSIDLIKEAGITFNELSCSAEELFEFKDKFDRVFQEELHDGEKEALVLLQKQDDLQLCTCDYAAIKALGLLDLSAQGISFENMLKKSGINKKLEFKHTEKRFKKYLTEGSIMKIQGRGLEKKRGE